ncbi:hypothetical protein [Nocardia noduli]|uniref:hypothetical protein n=1 Tax=Nocardia noduli TaxID=2815722 RepID=UPI001C220DF5|nr:hypothetical protein [Nocardia noduli]
MDTQFSGTFSRPVPGLSARTGKMVAMSGEVTVILLLALSGFLLGGAYSLWKTTRPLAITLAVCGVLAAGGAIVWWL